MANFYTNPEQLTQDLIENQYLLLEDLNRMTVDKFCFQNGNLRKINFPTVSNKYIKQIKPKNDQQVFALDMLQDRTSKVKLLRGQYGAGKDFLALNQVILFFTKALPH